MAKKAKKTAAKKLKLVKAKDLPACPLCETALALDAEKARGVCDSCAGSTDPQRHLDALEAERTAIFLRLGPRGRDGTLTPDEDARVETLNAEIATLRGAADAPPAATDAHGGADHASAVPADASAPAPDAPAQEAEAGAAPEPARQMGLFPPPPFDAEKAVREIEDANVSMASARRAYEDAKEKASELKRAWETESKALEELIVSMKERRLEAERQHAPRLVAAIVQGVAAQNPEALKPGCSYERETGKPCPICRERKAANSAPAPSHADHPEHQDHAVCAAVIATDEAFQAELRKANVRLEMDEIEELGLSTQERDEVLAWASALVVSRTTDTSVTVPVRPARLKTMHEAAATGLDGERQCCRICGVTLRDKSDLEADGEGYYPDGALVGTDCEGEMEEARPIAKRGSKKGHKKHDPEAERAAQAAAAPVQDEAVAPSGTGAHAEATA